MKFIIVVLLVVLTGCAAKNWKVYAPEGKIYQAPDLCQAVQQCLDAGEKSCSYETYKGAYEVTCSKVTQ